MTDKELRRLSRSELVDIIFELQKQNQQKDAECRKLQDVLQQRELVVSDAGSIAEAALQINGVMEAAQAAADQYLLSVKAAGSRAEQIISDAEMKRDRMLREAQERAAQILKEAGAGAERIWGDFQRKASEMIRPQEERTIPMKEG